VVVIARSGLTARFPARFTLVLAANPQPGRDQIGAALGMWLGGGM
jgi:predicted ATPase with chaperone activity